MPTMGTDSGPLEAQWVGATIRSVDLAAGFRFLRAVVFPASFSFMAA